MKETRSGSTLVGGRSLIKRQNYASDCALEIWFPRLWLLWHWQWYLQLTLSVTVVSYFSPSFIARLNTTQRYRAPSSSFVGVRVNVLVVWWSFEPPRFTMACKGVAFPSRYHLQKLNVTWEKENENGNLRVSPPGTHVRDGFPANWKNYLRDCGIWWATNAAARQFLFLFLRCDNNASGSHKWRLRWCQNRQIVILLMDVIPSSLCFDSAFEAAIVAAVWCIGDAQIINSLVGSVVDSVWKKLAISELIWSRNSKIVTHLMTHEKLDEILMSKLTLPAEFLLSAII